VRTKYHASSRIGLGLTVFLSCALAFFLGACPPTADPNGSPNPSVTEEGEGEAAEGGEGEGETPILTEGESAEGGEGEQPAEGEGEQPPVAGEGEGEGEWTEGQIPDDSALWLCDYWPLAEGNFWDMTACCDIGSAMYVRGAFEWADHTVWEIDHVEDGIVVHEYIRYHVFLDGYLQYTSAIEDIYALPERRGTFVKGLPERMTPSVPVIYWEDAPELPMTPLVGDDARAALAEAGIDIASLPTEDIVVLMLHAVYEELGEVMVPWMVLGRDLGPVWEQLGGLVRYGIAATGCR